MTSYETNETTISKALADMIITPQDYALWRGVQGYKDKLKKANETNSIGAADYFSEQKKIGGVHWLRDTSTGKLNFKLVGANFKVFDLLNKGDESGKVDRVQNLFTHAYGERDQTIEDKETKLAKIIVKLVSENSDLKRQVASLKKK